MPDRELLTQMLANVVENAIRHTPAGTRIELTLRQDNRTILGAITDNGPAGGKRLRQLPMLPNRVQAALRAA